MNTSTFFRRHKTRSRRRCTFESLLRRELMAVDFIFHYPGSIGSGIGFEDAAVGQMRRDALESAANQFGHWFDHTATIELNVISEEDAASDTIASALSAFTPVSLKGFGVGEVIRQKVIEGVDLNGGVADGEVTVNWAINWHLGTDPTEISGEQEDFFGTLYHELAHTFGFGTDIRLDGEDGYGTPAGQPGTWTQFDRYLTAQLGQPIINSRSFVLNASLWDDVKIAGASPQGGLFFNGPRAVAVNGGPVGLYSPVEFSSGSSWSHLDDENPTFDQALMRSSGLAGATPPREFSPLERAMFEDLGFNLTSTDVISIQIADASIVESQETTVTVSRSAFINQDELTLQLMLSDSDRVNAPATVTIAANTDSATFTIMAVQDLQVEPDSQVVLRVDAIGFQTSTANLTVADNPFPFQNPNNIFDVSGNGAVTVSDALRIVNLLPSENLPTKSPADPNVDFYDVSGDNKITALDALLVINEIARVENESSAGQEQIAPDWIHRVDRLLTEAWSWQRFDESLRHS